MSDTLIVDQSGPQLVVRGSDRLRFVNGMCMGNVAAIPPGGFLKTAMLSPKGRILAVFDVLPRADDLLLIMQAELVAPTLATLDRHVIADDVTFEVIQLAVHRVWGEPGAVWDAPPILGAAVAPAPATAVEIRRIEAGLPLYGIDLSDDNFPFETPLARLIDYKKGCYLGQEPIARVAARGNPSRLLRGFRIAGEAPVAAGTVIAAGGKADAGRVTSAALSPRFGAIALGYLPRGASEPGREALVGGRAATVVELPFV